MSIAEAAMKALVAARGGAKFARALARGDIADDATVQARREVCRECPTRVRAMLAGMTAESDWCGQPFQPGGMKMDPPRCGCLLAGKTLVGSESCPQRKWLAVPLTITKEPKP